MEIAQPLLPHKLITRIAPTPSGFVHMGNALNFIITASIARMTGGTLHLRIDDFDTQRVREESVADILWSLDYLGIKVDHGPSGIDDWKNNFSQKQYEHHYFEEILNLSGPRAYQCDCTRSEIFQQNPHGHYHGKCRGKKIDPTRPTGAWRFSFNETHSAQIIDLAQGAVSLPWENLSGDIQLRRGDGTIGYHPLSVLEDKRMGVNLIVRGADLFSSSLIQQTLMEEWDWDPKQLPTYFHHGTITTAGQKLSKTKGSQGLRQLSINGQTTAGLYQRLATAFGVKNSQKMTSLNDWAQWLAEQPAWSFLTQTVDLPLGP